MEVPWRVSERDGLGEGRRRKRAKGATAAPSLCCGWQTYLGETTSCSYRECLALMNVTFNALIAAETRLIRKVRLAQSPPLISCSFCHGHDVISRRAIIAAARNSRLCERNANAAAAGLTVTKTKLELDFCKKKSHPRKVRNSCASY